MPPAPSLPSTWYGPTALPAGRAAAPPSPSTSAATRESGNSSASARCCASSSDLTSRRSGSRTPLPRLAPPQPAERLVERHQLLAALGGDLGGRVERQVRRAAAAPRGEP